MNVNSLFALGLLFLIYAHKTHTLCMFLCAYKNINQRVSIQLLFVLYM